VSFLLDTNLVSELRKGQRINPGVRAWFDAVDEADLFLSVLVIGELRQGVERIQRRDAPGARSLSLWLERLIDQHANRILPIDIAISELWGRLNVPDPLPTVDGLLAATALVNDLTLVTRNLADVARTGARTLNPFV
jgi:toxin FitB